MRKIIINYYYTDLASLSTPIPVTTNSYTSLNTTQVTETTTTTTTTTTLPQIILSISKSFFFFFETLLSLLIIKNVKLCIQLNLVHYSLLKQQMPLWKLVAISAQNIIYAKCTLIIRRIRHAYCTTLLSCRREHALILVIVNLAK